MAKGETIPCGESAVPAVKGSPEEAGLMADVA